MPLGATTTRPTASCWKSEQIEDITEAVRYYFGNIIGPFKPKIRRLAKIADLDIDLVSHRPWTGGSDPWRMVICTAGGAQCTGTAHEKIIIAYASAYSHAKQMATSSSLRDRGSK